MTQGGAGVNGGVQPYDDYAHMDRGDGSVATRHRGRRLPKLRAHSAARRAAATRGGRGLSQEQVHVAQEHAAGLTVLDPRLSATALARAPPGASDDSSGDWSSGT